MRSFPLFIKERNILFGFISHTKIANLAKKECKRTQRSFYKVKKESSILISIYIYIFISIYIYIYIYLYISIYIYWRKKRNILTFFCKRTKRSHILLHSLQKNVAFFAFFSILCRRTLHSLRSFGSHKSLKPRKKNGKEPNIPFKERKRMERTEQRRMQCPTLYIYL